MKKLGRAIFLVGLMLILFTVLFVACNTNSTDNNQVQNGNQQSDANNDTNGQFIVTVHPNNGNSTFKWTIASDIPSIEREGYYFDGIYLDSTFMSATSFESLKKTGIKSNLDVYVKWTSHKHEFGSWHILIKPTHISEGLRVWYCSLCDAEKYETMPKVGEHVFSLVWTIDIESTTTTDGEKSHHCTILGCTERKDITTIPKKDSDGSSTPVGHEHNMVLLEKVPATCTVVGYEINKCEECDYVKRTTLPIVSNTIDHRELLAGEKCTKCGYTSISNLRDSVLMYNTSYDTYCAEYYGTIVEKDIFEYYNQRINLAYLSDTIETIARDSFKDWISLDHIILPNTITKIEENAFYGCSLLNAVSIPDSVEEIEESAFAQCINLEKISMSQSLKHIGKNVLWGTKWFEDQPAGLLYLGNVAVAVKQGCLKVDAIKEGTRIVADDFFAGQSELSIITIPSTVLHFGEKVFDGCSNLSGVFYNAINAECKDNLFGNRTSLEHAVFGKNVEKVPEGLFAGCTQLADVIFVGNNVTEIGASAFFKCSKLAAIIVPDSVTSIGESVFEGCNGLTSITIPDSVTSIGSSIFLGCSSLENITIPFLGEKAGVTSSDAYQYPFGYIFGTSSYTGGVATTQYYYGNSTSSTTSTTYYIPSSLKSVTVTGGNILYGAFYNCSGLTSVTIGNSVTSIGNSAFYGCNNLRDIYITDIAAWCNISGLYNLMEYGASNKKLYINNELATSITIPDGVTAIPSSAFRGFTGLTIVSIGNSVTSIGGSAFEDCTGLTSITIPASVTSIGSSAFSGCYRLVEVYNKSALSITAGSFDAYYVKNVYTTEGGSKLSTDENGYIIYTDGDEKILVSYTGTEKKLTLPSCITQINQYTFSGCSNLTNITIPDSVTSIGSSAFEGCSSLTSITIPDSVTSIGRSAFLNCTGLTSMTLPFVGASAEASKVYEQVFGYIFGYNTGSSSASGATYQYYDYYYYIPSSIKSVTITGGKIPSYAFCNCSNLTNITIPDSVTSIGSSAFSGCTGLKSINFEGTKAQWNLVSKGDSWNTSTGSYTIYCTDGTIYK